MKILLKLAPLALAIVMIGCSQKAKEPTAGLYADPPELKACNDSLDTFMAALEAEPTFEQMKGIYDHFLQISPNSTVLHRELQSIFDGYGKTDDKIAYYKQLQEQNPKSAMFAYLYGRALSGTDQAQFFRKAVELDPNYFWGHYGVASRSLAQSPPDTAAAIAAYSKCIEIDNTFPSSFEQLVNIYAQKKDYSQALKFADLMAVTSPDALKPITLKSNLLIAKGAATEAEQVLRDFAASHPDNAAVRKQLVDMFREQRRWAEALTYQHQMVPLARQPGDALFDLAKLYVQSDNNDSAIAYLNMAAAQGFSDYRRLERNPFFSGLRSAPAYPEVVTNLKKQADQQREMRLAGLAKMADFKEKTLAERLDLPAPPFTFTNLEGKQVALADLRGKVVVIDFWATWCGPCRMTMPLLQDYVDRLPQGVEFISMDVWENDTSLVRPFLADYGYTFNVLYGDRDVADRYQVSGIPTLFVIDKEGTIRYRHVGYDPYADQKLLVQTESLL